MTNTVWDRIEEARSRWNVLEHPFYQRWSAGELSEDELAAYAGQYRHAVEAIAGLSAYLAAELPADQHLAEHAREEVEHIDLWDGFVESVGGDSSAAPNAETAACKAEWTKHDGPTSALARLYAIESGQPEISRTKLDGLAAHYGVPEGPGSRYFSVHEGRDVEHATEGRALLQGLLAEGGEDATVAAAEAAFEANWKLLDGVS